MVVRFFRNLNNATSNAIIPSKPGLFSIWIFPFYILILVSITAMLWWIHYPDILNGYAVVKKMDVEEQQIQLEIDNPRNSLAKLRAGQPVRINSAGNIIVSPGMLKGRIQSVSEIKNHDKVTAVVQLSGDLTMGPVARAAYKSGAPIDLMVVVNDMPLLMRIFYSSANTISTKK